MKFCHLKMASGAVDTRKWTAKWRNCNISDIFFSFRSIDERKQRRQPETFAPYGDNATGESTERKSVSRFKEDRFNISDTPRSGKPSGFDEDRLNALIHNDPCQCTRELANVMNCDHSIFVRHLHSMSKVKKNLVYEYRMLSTKTTKIRGGHMCIYACSSSIG